MSRKVFEDQWEPALTQQTEFSPRVAAEVNLAPEVHAVTLGLLVGHGVFVGRHEKTHLTLLACLDFDSLNITGGAIFNVVPEGFIVARNPHNCARFSRVEP